MNKIQVDKVDLLFRKISLYGDKEAFRTLFYDFFSPLCIYAQRYLDDMESCEDIVQEVFYRIWRDRENLSIQTSSRGFLITCVRNACLDLLRRHEVEQRWMETSMNMQTEEDDTDLYSTRELEQLLEDALAKLPEKVAVIFRKNRFEGKTYAEIAVEQDISVKTVEANMSKALKFLRVELKDYLPVLMALFPNVLG